jgi:hypothetical protein
LDRSIRVDIEDEYSLRLRSHLDIGETLDEEY